MKRWAILLAVYGEIADLITTSLPGGEEANVFARDAAHHPLIAHLVVLKLFYIGLYAVIGLIAYRQIERFSSHLADCLIVGLALFFALDSFEVAFQNFLLFLNWAN